MAPTQWHFEHDLRLQYDSGEELVMIDIKFILAESENILAL